MAYNRTMKAPTLLPIERALYSQYGDVIAVRDDAPFVPANMGTAKRYNFIADVQNLRPGSARLNFCLFRCSPYTAFPLNISLLERHRYSTQVFLPQGSASRYVAVVCLGGDVPDLSTLRAFLVEGAVGVSYKPGIWHHPMIVLGAETVFNCLVWEDGTHDDCHVYNLPTSLLIEASS